MHGATLERSKARQRAAHVNSRVRYTVTAKAVKPDGKLTRQHKKREILCLLKWALSVGIIFVLGTIALNGFAILNAETRTKVELNQQIVRSLQQKDDLKAELKQRTAPLDVAKWAQEAGMIPASEKKSLVLQPHNTPDPVVIGALTH
ncbi:MAG: hypothetical protein KIT45_01205 [Fimbriimonadia bacterium]|nr:hypothetical protein [Fimbriimonadia bacterium]